MPKYRVKERSNFGGVFVDAGAIVEFDGVPGTNLEPMDGEGKKRQDSYLESIRPKTEHELFGQAVGNAMANPHKAEQVKVSGDTNAQPVVVQDAAGAHPTTIGHSSVVEQSAGGRDAERLLHNDADGKLEHDDPDNKGPVVAKADPAPKRTDNPSDRDPREARQSVDTAKAQKTAAKKGARH